MNEIIKELVENAGIDLISYRYNETSFYAEKVTSDEFKALINLVKEKCISACANDSLGKTMSAEDLINKEFGVEE